MAIAAYDIAADGKAVSVDPHDPEPRPGPGFAYRWLHFDLNRPGLADWMQKHFTREVSDSFLMAETRPRCDEFDSAVLVNLRGANMNPGAAPDDMVAIRILVDRDLIITARRRRLFSTQEIEELIRTERAPASQAAWLAAFLQGLLRVVDGEIEKLENNSGLLEDDLLKPGNDAPESDRLAEMRFSAIKFKRYLRPQADALHRLYSLTLPGMDRSTRLRLRELANTATRLNELVESLDHRHAVMQDHVQNRTTAIVTRNGFVLSAVAAIFLPITFVTGLLGMNVAGLPGTEWSGSFWAVTATLTVIGGALYLYFRLRKWL